MQEAYLRIGEVARRAGLSPHVLRAWERRYGVPRPARTEGGFRLYPPEEVERIVRMRTLIERGVAPAEAARAVSRIAPARGPEGGRPAHVRGEEPSALETLVQRMELALEGYDEPGAHAAIDRLLATFSLETVLERAFLPYLRRVGERWAAGELTAAHEHFGSTVIRGRLLGLAREWATGVGPVALLACPEGELHDLGLLIFGVALGHRGWRIVLLGADTPLETIVAAADELRPRAIVLAITMPSPSPQEEDVRRVAARHPLFLAGAGAEELARRAGVPLLPHGPVEAARALARLEAEPRWRGRGGDAAP